MKEILKEPFEGFINAYYPKGQCTQWFGENPILYGTMGMLGHNGIDYASLFGTKLYAVKKGYICDIAYNPDTGYGNEIRIRTESGEVWIYAHMSKVVVSLYQEVNAGDYVGDMGNTGFVVSNIDANGFWVKGSNKNAGTHLHIAKRKIHDYVHGVDKNWHGSHKGIPYVVENLDNGFNGWLDVREELSLCIPIKEVIIDVPNPLPPVEEIKNDIESQGFSETWQKIVYFFKKYLGLK